MQSSGCQCLADAIIILTTDLEIENQEDHHDINISGVERLI